MAEIGIDERQSVDRTMEVNELKCAVLTSALRCVPERASERFATFFGGVWPKWFFLAHEKRFISLRLVQQTDPDDPLGISTSDEQVFLVDLTVEAGNLVLDSDMAYFSGQNNFQYTGAAREDALLLDPGFEAPRSRAVVLTGYQSRRIVELRAPFRTAIALKQLYADLGGESNFLSTPLGWTDSWGVGPVSELFGNPFNTQGAYCSAFPIEKILFGSRGSFFEVELAENEVAIANPPFDETLCAAAVRRVLDQLTRTRATVVWVLPAWDRFEASRMLLASPFLRSVAGLTKALHPFYSFESQRAIPIANAHLLVVSSDAGGSVPVAQRLADLWAWRTKAAAIVAARKGS